MKNSFYYLTVEELNKLNQFDFTDHPDLEISRDIFMLQSETGMRICDVLALTSANVIGGAIQYVERKTNKVIHVPLTSSGSWEQVPEVDYCRFMLRADDERHLALLAS